MTNIGKENKSSQAYLIKNSKGEGEDRGWGGGGGGETGGRGVSEGSRKDWAELYGCIK